MLSICLQITNFMLVFNFLLVSCSEESNPNNDIPVIENKIEYPVSIPTEGNSWVTNNASATANIVGVGGISNWTNNADKIRTYFYANKTGEIEVGLQAKFSGNTSLKITLNDVNKTVSFEASTSFIRYDVGKFSINQIGY